MMLSKDLEQELRGSYRTSFFHIFLNGVFCNPISQMSCTDAGTFIHEYIHYIQNIGTLWGLGFSTFFYRLMQETIHSLQSEKYVSIPHPIVVPDKLNKINLRYTDGLGSNCDSDFMDIDQSKDIEIRREGKLIELKVTFMDHSTKLLSLGSHIIKESMAALYQSIVDPQAKHPDISYNLIQILCRQEYPKLDTRLIICACFTSLFNPYPGVTLLRLLKYASNNENIDGILLFDDYINSHTLIVDHSRLSIVDGFDVMVDKFKNLLKSNLQVKLDYIEVALDHIKLSQDNSVPILTILYDKHSESFVEKFQKIINYSGIPFIQHSKGIHYAKSVICQNGNDEPSEDVIELQALEAVFAYILGDSKVCPLSYMCINSKYEKPECYDTPWNGNECFFTLAAPFLKGKERKNS